MPVRACTVSFTDAGGVTHSVDVEAESLFEAAATGLARLKKDGWVEQVSSGARLEIAVREPSTRHVVSVRQLERWVNGVSRSPADTVRKARFRDLLKTTR